MAYDNNENPTSLQFVRLRVARLSASGTTPAGAGLAYVSNQMIRLGISPVYDDGEEITERTGAGELCLEYSAPDNLRRLNVTLELCVPDPEFAQMLVGGDLLLNVDGETIGMASPAVGPVDENGVSIEGWTRAILKNVVPPANPYWRFVLPKVNQWRVGDRELNSGRLPTLFTGKGFENPNFGNGPFNDYTALHSDRVWSMIRDSALPAAAAGAIAIPAQV